MQMMMNNRFHLAIDRFHLNKQQCSYKFMYCDEIQVKVGNVNIMEKGVISAAIIYQIFLLFCFFRSIVPHASTNIYNLKIARY